jgi:organic hydroperoxide reductase OsmC/OhrA
VHVDSAASTEDVRALVEAAKRGCFVEQTLARSVEVRHNPHHGKLVACLEDQTA